MVLDLIRVQNFHNLTETGKNVSVFGVDVKSFVHIDSRTKDI